MRWDAAAREQLRRHEGVRAKPYPDTSDPPKLTVGIGRCLTTKPLKPCEIEFLFEQDFQDAEDDARALVGDSVFDALSDARKAVMVNMAFNLGLTGLRKFVRFLAAVKEARYRDAAKEMLGSLWAQQVKDRAFELAKQMETG